MTLPDWLDSQSFGAVAGWAIPEVNEDGERVRTSPAIQLRMVGGPKDFLRLWLSPVSTEWVWHLPDDAVLLFAEGPVTIHE